MPITPTARRIAHAHNCCGPALSGGLLGFDSEGRGGAWYSGRCQPPAEIVYPVRRGRVSVRDVQAWLNERETSRAGPGSCVTLSGSADLGASESTPSG
jgi:hypothetical protein